jgi:uncharacterized protein (DUF1330 family)
LASGARLTLCVLLWARPGQERALVEYEDKVLRLLPAHGGRVLQRARTNGAGAGPLEIHLLELPSEAALEAYMNDPQRVALAPDRDGAIERTELHRVDLV